MPPIERLYLRLPNWVGDVCMSLPALSLLQSAGLPLTLCARPWARDLLSGLPGHDFIPMTGRVWHDGMAVRRAMAAGPGRVRTRGLLLPDSLSSALVFFLAGIPSAGYRDDGRSPLLKWPVRKPAPGLHAVESWYALARAALRRWGLDPGSPAPGPGELALTDAHRSAAGEHVARHGLKPGGFVLIAPTATGLHRGKVKVWPHFDAYVRALQADGVTVAMCPPASEADQARRNAPTATLLPPLGLGAYAALAQQAALVVCNDSGVSHLAAAVGARQLTLFGVTDRSRTGPWSPRAVCLGENGAWPAVDAVLEHTATLLSDPADT